MKKLLFGLSICAWLISCNQQTTNNQTTETPTVSPATQMKQAYIGIVQAFETGNTDSLGNYVTENTVDHAEPMPGITSTGLQRLKDIIAMYRGSFPDMSMTFHHVVADGDMLFAHVTWSGTNTGSFMGGLATNKSVSGEFIDILRFENGKAAEHWEVSDQLSFLTQMGIIPQQGEAPAPVSHPTYDWNAPVTSTSEQVVKMKESYSAVVNIVQQGDLTNLDQYLAADFKEHVSIPGVTLPDGIEGAKQAMTMWKQAYPDMKLTVERVAAEGDVLMAQALVEGTYSGSVPGLPAEAKGKMVKFYTVDIIKFGSDGKATDHWEVTDHYTEMVQLGVIPAPEAQGGAPN